LYGQFGQVNFNIRNSKIEHLVTQKFNEGKVEARKLNFDNYWCEIDDLQLDEEMS
jgi:hypothetical protein